MTPKQTDAGNRARRLNARTTEVKPTGTPQLGNFNDASPAGNKVLLALENLKYIFRQLKKIFEG